MAQRQYSFDFVLNAVLNGGFSGVFTKAQQEFIRLGNEIKNLQAIQRDIASYQKQQAAVQNTTSKLSNLRRQYELVKKQISETTGSTTALEREKLKLEQRISSTEAALGKQQAQLDGTKSRLDAAGVSTNDLSNKDAELTEKIKELTEEQKKAAEGAGDFKTSGVEAMEAISGAIAAAGIAESVGKIKDAFVECVTTAADFGQAMSAVKAISGANASEMAALTAEAKELGATTVFTAQQSADAMEYMAMAGWDASEMLAGMSSMTTLAAAAGEDLAQVSDIVTDNLTAFGLKASDTAHFADVLAAAAANSNTNIAIMGETFKSSASVAGALGYSIEDVAVMTGLMANSAVKGSRAATTLRNIFNGLLSGVTLTSKAFGELDYSAVNYDGSMKGLTKTVKDLRGYFSQMTEAERVNNAINIAGQRGYNGLLAILNATDEDFQSLYDSINNCSGAAERMAAVKLDNLNGDITLMNSAMEALKTTVGEEFNPELRKLTQFGTEALNWLENMIEEAPGLTKGIIAGAGAFTALGAGIVGVNAAIKVFKALELASLFTGTAGVLLGVAGGIAAVTAVVVGTVEATRDGGKAVRELTEAAREMNAAMDEAKATYEDTAVEILATANTADFYIRKLEEIEAAEGENAAQNQQYQNTLALLLQVMPSLSDCISQTTDEYGRATYALETSTEALKSNTEEWQKNAKAQAYQEYMNSLMENYNDVLKESAKNEIELTLARHRQEIAQSAYNDALERSDELQNEAIAAAELQSKKQGGLVDSANYLTQEYYDLQNSLGDLRNELDAANADVAAHEKAIDKDAEAVAAAEEAMKQAEEVAGELTGAMGDYADGQGDLMATEEAVQEALDGTIAKLQELADSYTEAYEEAIKSFSGQFGLFDEAQADADATIAAAQAALNTQLSYWQSYASNIAVLKGISAEDLGVTQENYNALMNYVRSGTPEAAGLAADMVKAVNDGNTQALTDLANTLGEIDASQEQAAQDVAEWASGLNKQMEELISDMEGYIEELDMSAEAAGYARETVQSYINAASNMLPQVQSAYARLAQAARSALAGATATASGTVSFALGTLRGTGFAKGTYNAPPGWAWVGEEGPELMRMRGGEQILPSEVSKRVSEEYRQYVTYSGNVSDSDTIGDALRRVAEIREEYRQYEAYSGGTDVYSPYMDQSIQRTQSPLEITTSGYTASGSTKIEMHFHIEAGASPETVAAWQEYGGGELKSVILEVMEDAEADMRRRELR